jgi:signal transduction histidine kinase/ActR/RegA family two-component response regulator
MSKHTRTIFFHYGGAVVFTALAVLLRWLLDPVLGDSQPFTTLFGSVAFAVWLGGYRPALLAMLLGYFTCNYLFIEPRGAFTWPDCIGLVRLIFYLLSSTVIIAFGEAMRVAQHRAEESQKDTLEQKMFLVREVQSRIEMEEAMKEADRRKDQFLATLAHELRNPLAPLRNSAEVLRCAKGDAALIEQARGMIQRQVGHMVRLIDDLLDISRITKGKLQLRKERVGLASVVRTAQETSLPLLKAAGHDFTVTMPDEPIFLDADPVRLAQVLSNLLNNAAKYTEKGGRIQLSVERQGPEAVVTVRDSRIGIAAEHLPRIFDMFSQVRTTLERSQGGLGVRLSLVKGLVELHGGRVEARSDGPGKGSEFIVRLPIADGPARAAAESVDGEKPHDGLKRRILVVDDNRDSADNLATMLQLMGHDTMLAHDGLEAVQAAAAYRPDVVLLDLGLPQMNGYEAARLIREQQWGQNMVIIALTGWGQEEDKKHALEAGFDHHLTKPVGAEVLQDLLIQSEPCSAEPLPYQ